MTRLFRSLRQDDRGVVYVEFLLAFAPLFVLFLGLVQLAMLHGARIVVQQAAREGARSAAVVLPDDPQRYGGAPIGELMPEQDEQADPPPVNAPEPKQEQEQEQEGSQSNLHPLLAQLGAETAITLPDPPWDPPAPGPRLAAIQRGIYFRLSSLAPSASQLAFLWRDLESVGDALDDGHITRMLIGTLFYGAAVTSISFPVEPGSEEVHARVIGEATPLVHVRVTHLFHCTIPLVAALMCEKLEDLGVQRDKRDITCPSDDPLLQGDLDRIPSRTGLRLLAATPQRFFVMREEASFPYQRAGYRYEHPEEEE